MAPRQPPALYRTQSVCKDMVTLYLYILVVLAALKLPNLTSLLQCTEL